MRPTRRNDERFRRLAAALAMLVAALSAPAFAEATAGGDPNAERRVAIVIGNGAYDLAPLANPVNDAQLISAALVELGFQVNIAENLTAEGFEAFLESTKDAATGADVLFVYYAGHAIQHRGDNLLLMTDLENTSLDQVVAKSASVVDMIHDLADLNPGILVLVLDACRDSPFAAGEGRESGLSYVETSTGEAMIAYATSAGQVALDGAGENSPYAVALTNALQGPSKSLTTIFRDVRRQVREATNGKQIPWVSSSIEEDIVLGPDDEPPPEAPSEATEAAEASGPGIEEVYWHFIQQSADPRDFQVYLQSFPTGRYADEARRKLQVEVAALDPALSPVTVFQGAAAQPVVRDIFGSGEEDETTDGEMLFATTGDRFPIEELRLWPRTLPPSEEGFASIASECDILAADPDDPARVAPGVQMGLVSIRQAIRACIAEIAQNPDSPRRMFQLGRTLEVARYYPWAIYFYERAAALDYSAALVNLGYLYRIGRGVEQDYRRAFELYKRAALQGNLRARTNIGSLYREGWGVPQSDEEALLWYRLAGGSGWLNAIDALAGMYKNGQGVDKSPETAARLYLLAAEAGQTNAMHNIGRAYLKGEGVEKDVAEGRRWLEAGVAAGNRWAEQSLAMEIMGEDPARAETLLLSSADRGVVDARLRLAKLYLDRGGREGRLEAAFQALLAQELGSEKASELREAAEAQFSAEERAAVEDRVRNWLLLNGT